MVFLISYLSPVIIWNPSQQYLIYFWRGIKCPLCEERLYIGSWNTGKDISTLYYMILLCGASCKLHYSCSNKHNIISYDLRLLSLILDKTEIPFSLSYQTSFTKKFLRFLVPQNEQGYDFSKVITTVENCRSQLNTHRLWYAMVT